MFCFRYTLSYSKVLSELNDHFLFTDLFLVVGPEIEEQASNRLGCQIKQLWGMSELSPLGTGNPDDGLKKLAGSCGPPLSSTSCKVVDVETREALPPGEVGELLVKGPQVMKGYLNEEEKTKECLDDEGWLATGDIAKFDADGYMFIVDRMKELIKYKGFQVAPAELEAVLCTHDSVLDAAVIPRNDDDAGEVPRAYVVFKSHSDETTVDDLHEYINARVAPHKKLRGGIKIVDSIPKTNSGKILRREVLKLDANED